uniref:Uncharacterized protein n=1 Tax=Amphimedon queenslandica TaxID=400682 RepID=A0A1X7V217_AMPQE
MVEDNTYELQFILGGNYKFLLLLLGFNAANANYSCIYCTIKKDKRFDTTVPSEEYQIRQARTLSSITACAETRLLGVIHPPLLRIEMDQVVIDELHLMLRISDVLIRNLIGIAQVYDIKKSAGARHLDSLVDSIKSCGVTFYTSLHGADKKTLLRQLPTKLTEIIPDDLGRQLMKHWTDFNDIYHLIGTANPTDQDKKAIEEKALQWIQDFIKFPFDGLKKANVTPYMHIMAYHVPLLMRRHKGIKRFTGQGVEKNNDLAKKLYFSSNHQDAARDILLTEGHIEELQQGSKRQKRRYNKKDNEYWQDDIRQKRRKQSLLEAEDNLDKTNEGAEDTDEEP